MRPIPFVATARFGIFTTSEALSAGWTPDALAHAVAVGRLERLRRAVYRVPAQLSKDRFASAREAHAAHAIGFLLRNPRAVASHGSAAVLHGVPVLQLPALPCVTVAPGAPAHLSGAHLHRADLPRHHLVTTSQGAWTTLERTIVDLAREHGVAGGLVTADAALYGQLTDEQALAHHVAECGGWPGVRAARAVLTLVDSRSESPLETISRLRLHERGVPAPELQPLITDHDGRAIARPDFYWDGVGVAGEADGLDKYADDFRRVRAEKLRQERMENTGLIVVRWGSPDLDDLDRLVERLNRAFDRGSRRRAADRRWGVRFAPRFIVPDMRA